MGVNGLWKLIDSAGKQVTLESLEGKVFAIDASILLNQAVKGMSDQPNAHLHVLFLRICKLLMYKIKPIFVFDGAAPILKKQTIAARQKRREEASEQARSVSERLKRKAVQHLAVGKALGKRKVAKQPKYSETDLFELPPLPQPLITEDAGEDDYYELPIHSMLYSGDIDISQVDIKSEEFKSLPLEYQHEILEEVKEHTRHNSASMSAAKVDQADEFSSFQIAKLVKSNKLTNQIEVLRKQMLSNMADTAGEDHVGVLEANRVMSEDSMHYLLVKGAPRPDVKWESLVSTSTQSKSTEATSSSYVDPSNSSRTISHDQLSLSDDDELLTSQTQNVLIQSITGKSKLKNADKRSSAGDPSSTVIVSSDSEGDDEILSTSSKNSVNNSKISNPGSSLSTNELPDNQTSISTSTADPLSIESKRETSKGTNVHKSIYPEDKQLLEKKSNDFLPENVLSNVPSEPSPSDNAPGDDAISNIGVNQSKQTTSTLTDQTESPGSAFIISPEIHTTGLVSRGLEKSAANSIAVSSEATGNDGHVLHTDESDSSDGEFIQLKTCAKAERDKASGTNPALSGLASEILETDKDLDVISSELATNEHHLTLDLQKQQSMSQAITQQMTDDAIELLRLFGIPFVMSPSEAEAQCAKLEELGLCNGTITDDSDIWLFGGKYVLKNFFQQNRFVTSFTSKDIMRLFGLDREKLIALALVSGSDYTDGIFGAGPVTAIEIISLFGANDGGIPALRMFKTWIDSVQANGGNIPTNSSNTASLAKLRKYINSVPEAFPNHVVVEAYLKPRVDDSKELFEWGRPDLDLLRKFAHRTLNWPTQKVDDLVCPAIKRMNATESQSKLSSFFNVETTINASADFQSKRLKSAISKLITKDKTTEEPNKSHDAAAGGTHKQPQKQQLSRRAPKGKVSKATAGKRKQTKAGSKRNFQPPSVNIALIQTKVNLSESDSSD